MIILFSFFSSRQPVIHYSHLIYETLLIATNISRAFLKPKNFYDCYYTPKLTNQYHLINNKNCSLLYDPASWLLGRSKVPLSNCQRHIHENHLIGCFSSWIPYIISVQENVLVYSTELIQPAIISKTIHVC